MSWSWRTKPRSIIKTVQWFKYFGDLEGKNWNLKLDKTAINNLPIHPIRREYIFNAHRDEDSFLSDTAYEDYMLGKFDIVDKESNGRNDKTTFEFFGFGFVDNDGIIRVTDVGKKIVENKFHEELFLKQLLKLKFPNPVSLNGKKSDKNNTIFPLELILKALQENDYLNRYEIGLLFGCENNCKINDSINAIKTFRERYEKLDNKLNVTKVMKIFIDVYENTHGKLENTVNTLCIDYADALNRTLLYTGMFSLSGRGNNTKLRISEHAKKKSKMLLEKFKFSSPDFDKIEEYMQWYGNYNNVMLPWENLSLRKELIIDKIFVLSNRIEEVKKVYKHYENESFNKKDALEIVNNLTKENELREFETYLVEQITKLNEDVFIKYISKTNGVRDEIINKFKDILIGNEDMAALWLECNTWRSLLSINGEKVVKRNFSIEEDLTPKFFAPGRGNTPDMELIKKDYIIVPEVSLMTGVQQWEHEASSVVDHVLNIITKNDNGKEVIGLFISSKINIRTMWQFFILNKESWLEIPVPIIPITISQYMNILKIMYENDYDIDIFKKLLTFIRDKAIQCRSYKKWEMNIFDYIKEYFISLNVN